jgi:hypothetical protein
MEDLMTRVIHRQADTFQDLQRRQWQDEAELCAFIEGFPAILCRSDESVPLVVSREVSIRDAGRMDLLLLDDTGLLTIVEAKLAGNADHRRLVLAQIIDYAAELATMSFAELNRATNGKLGATAARLAPPGGAPAFTSKIEAVLAEGRTRLVIATDAVPHEVADRLAFLCAKARFDARIVTAHCWVGLNGDQLLAADIDVLNVDGVGAWQARSVHPIDGKPQATRALIAPLKGIRDGRVALRRVIDAYASQPDAFKLGGKGNGWQVIEVPGLRDGECHFGFGGDDEGRIDAFFHAKPVVRRHLESVLLAVARDLNDRPSNYHVWLSEPHGRLALSIRPTQTEDPEAVALGMRTLVLALLPGIEAAFQAAGRPISVGAGRRPGRRQSQ